MSDGDIAFEYPTVGVYGLAGVGGDIVGGPNGLNAVLALLLEGATEPAYIALDRNQLDIVAAKVRELQAAMQNASLVLAEVDLLRDDGP